MAKLKPFLVSLCLLLFTTSCLSARFESSADRFNQCQLDRINALEPDHRVESEAGLTETWNPRHPELQCAGVSLIRRTIDPRGLHLPSFSPAPQLVMILQGRGVLGMSVPGCPQTYEEPQSRQQQRGSSSSRRREEQQRPDSHQKIRRFSRGDVIAIPPGTPYWTYNNGNEPLIAISLLDTSNLANQLDSTPRVFYLGGNPDLEYPETQQQQQEQGRHQQRQSPGGRRGGQHQEEREEQQQNEGGSVLSGFSPEFLAQALNTDEDTARRLQSARDERRQIVRVEGDLSFISPDWQEEEEQDEEQEEGGQSRQEPGRRHRRQQEEEEEEEEDQPRRRHKGEEQEDQPRRPRHGEEEERESRRFRREEEEEDQPRLRRHGEEEERESRRSRGEEEEEDQPRRRRHGEEEEREPRRSGGEEEGEEEEEDQPSSRETRQWSRRQHREERREPRRQGEEEEEEDEEYERRTERRSSPSRRGCGRNGIEETICTAKVRENIARPERADLYNPRAGRISTANSLTLPILRFLRLSAEYVNLYRNGIYAPHWNVNANSLMYVIRGRGRVQIVNCQGNAVFNDEVRKGQLIVVPQNFVVAQQAEEEGFEYVVFKTNDRAIVSHVKQVFRSTPAEVLENAFGLRQRQVTEIKFSGNRGPLVHPQSQSHGRVIAKVA